MLQATFRNDYPVTNKRGEKMQMYVYVVDGTKQELAEFESALGEYFRMDEKLGKPVWFSPGKYYGNSIPLIILPADENRSARVIADTSQIRRAAALADLYGGSIGAAIANSIAQQLMVQPQAITPGIIAVLAQPEPDQDDRMDA